MKDYLVTGLGVVLVVVVVLMCWKAQRTINWKWSYGGKVDKKIEQLEQRVDKLETLWHDEHQEYQE